MTARLMLLLAACLTSPLFAAQPGSPADVAQYEWLTVTAKPEKLDRVHAWFRAHRDDVLARHGGTNLAFLVPVGENREGRFVCLSRHPSSAAAARFRRDVQADPLWAPLDPAAQGPDSLVAQVAAVRLSPTAFSPEFTPSRSAEPRVFELRTYTCPSAEKLAFLHERFRNHTMQLFAKHGMENLVYWQPVDMNDSERKLVYLLAHRSVDAAKESFTNFRKDPEWLAAREASEKKAGGSLTEKEGGVVSEFFVATDDSPLR